MGGTVCWLGRVEGEEALVIEQEQVGAGDEHTWEVYIPDFPMPPGPVAAQPMCTFCAFVEDVEENYNVVGYWRADMFIVHDLYDGTPMPMPDPMALLMPDLLADELPVMMVPQRDWLSFEMFFACPRHHQLVQADARYAAPPARPAANQRASTGFMGAFYACRTGEFQPWPPITT